MSLTPEQIAFFRHVGFLKLPAELPGPLVESLKATVQRQIREVVEPVKRDSRGRVVRLSNIWERDPMFREALTCDAVLDPLEALLGPNIELLTNRHNHACLRLADDGTAYLHRDILQWTRSLVTVIFYLEETTLENGCTWAVPGTHFLPGRAALSLEGDEALRRTGLLEQAVPLPMRAGGLLAMDSLVFHGAGLNRTEGTRISLTAGYHSMDELSDTPDPKRVLVRGERFYRGNDY
jgi:ectoine hydroxylase-related dioxygenase (phytanoyl-CoA dioxygenase family)